MTGKPCWSDREPDEPLPDWMLRLQISYLAAMAADRRQEAAS